MVRTIFLGEVVTLTRILAVRILAISIVAVKSGISLICTFAGAGNAVPVTLSCLFILSHTSSLASMSVHGREPGMVKNEKNQEEVLKDFFLRIALDSPLAFWLSIEKLGLSPR